MLTRKLVVRYNTIMTEEHKKKLQEGREKKQAEKDSKFVSSDDFNNFKNSVVGILENISNKLNTAEPAERKVLMANEPEKQKKVAQQTPSNEPVVHNLEAISPEYEEIFQKYFDPRDGFTAMLKGINFKIEVPKNFSNAQEAFWSLYKHDIRHKVLDGQDIAASMEKYCKLVATNLNYKRNVMLKI